MKTIDNEIDRQHCAAIVHEYHRCRDSFNCFAGIAEQIILGVKSREISYRAYNAYSYFILHLYEFLVSLHARELGVTEIKGTKMQAKSALLDLLIQSTINKVVQNRICRIEQGLAPDWENHISAYQNILPIPVTFAEDFRRMRNKVGGHVTYERINKIDLTKFYEKNHMYLYLMYRDCGDWWAPRVLEFPNLEQVTDFFNTVACVAAT